MMFSYQVPRPAAVIGVCCVMAMPLQAEELKPVPIQKVQIEDGFWSPKLEVWSNVTIHDVFDKFEQYGGFRNFDRVAAGQTGGHEGEPWADGLIYETIRAAGDFLAANPDPTLHQRVRGFVARIEAAAARDADGYINTAQQLEGVGYKWTNPPAPGDNHDDDYPHTVYNAGCLVEAAVHLYEGTGDKELLRVATKLANYMCGIMGPPPKLNIIPGHALSEESFVKLYRLYRDKPGLEAEIGLSVNEADYLSLAQFWIENRGNTAGRASAGSYNQDNMSVFLQPTLQGHAVRSTLLATGMAAAAVENDRADYLQTLERWWQNMVDARMYLTGGLGAVAAHEGFGADHELPNDGYAETCAAVGGGFFGLNMNLLTGDAKYVDVLERELYNGALCGVSHEGDTYFYTNPLTATHNHRRWEWAGFGLPLTPCCPPMFLKLQSALPGCIYATSGSTVYVNLFIGSEAEIQTEGLDLQLSQTTNYPWDGVMEFEVNPATAASFTLKLRVPDWAESHRVLVNGAELGGLAVTKGYVGITREWHAGDKVSYELPMPVEKVKANPLVKANVGRAALMRGPMVYCCEGLDNHDEIKGFMIEPSNSFVAKYDPNLSGGAMLLEGRAKVIRNLGETYRKEPVTVRAIPFYANQNRAATQLDVWLPDDTDTVRPVKEGVPAASYCNPGDTVLALNDGILPRLSDDEGVPRMTWWNHKGTSEWAEIRFATARSVSSAGVYWWDERRVNRECRVPQAWSLQYLDAGGQWQPVQGAGSYGVEMDKFNRVNFQAVNTRGIRVVAQLQAGWSAGILEMEVGEASAVATASHTFAQDTVKAINDGRTPRASDDETLPRHTYWDHQGTNEWAQLSFSKPRRLSSLEVYWWDERRLNRACRVPQWWSLMYLSNGQWLPVQGATPYGTEMDGFNMVHFNEVETTAVRLGVQLQAGWSAGILELRAYEPSPVAAATTWLAQHGYAAGTSMESDEDGDGVSLLEAYALGLEPSANPTGGIPVPSYTTEGMSLSFWGGREDVLYSAEWSKDLRSWSSHGIRTGEPDGGGMRTVLLPYGGQAQFMRLRLNGGSNN
jgi:DUF1680 family protein